MPRSISPIGFRKPELTTDPRREGQVSVDQTESMDPRSDIVDDVRDILAQGVDVVGFYNQSGGRSFPSSGFMGAAVSQQSSGSSLNAAFGDGLGGNNQPSGWQQHVARQTYNIPLQIPGQQPVLTPNGYPINQNVNMPMPINANAQQQQQPIQAQAQYMTEEERMISEYTAKSTAQPAVNPHPMSRNEYLNNDGQSTKKANIVRMDANGQLVAEDVASIEAEIVDQNIITAEQLDNIPVIQTAEQKPKPPKPAPVLRTQGATKIAQEKKKLKVWKPKW